MADALQGGPRRPGGCLNRRCGVQASTLSPLVGPRRGPSTRRSVALLPGRNVARHSASALWVPVAGLTKVLYPEAARLIPASTRESVDPLVSTALLPAPIWRRAGARRRRQTHRLSGGWAYCSTRGGFIISRRRLARGRRSPFPPPRRRQYHSSDLSPFARLNV